VMQSMFVRMDWSRCQWCSVIVYKNGLI